MPKEFSRSRRIEEAILRLMSEALASRVRDPRLGGLLFTDVRVSRDLSVARIFFARLDGRPPGPEAGTALHSAAGFLRSFLAGELRMRHVPELRFFPDEALIRGRALENLIDSVAPGTPHPNPGDVDRTEPH